VGNIKVDQCKKNLTPEDEKFLREIYSLPSGKVIVCGATHEGEEPLLLDALLSVREQVADARMIIAPRYIERGSEIAAEAEKRGLSALRRSQEESFSGRQADVYIVDVFGELGRVYGLADVAFVGGTFVKRGGQNVLEPAALGKPVIYGDSTSTVQAWCEMLESVEGSVRVVDPKDLADVLLRFLQEEDLAEAMGKRAREALQPHAGALEKTLDVIDACVDW